MAFADPTSTHGSITKGTNPSFLKVTFGHEFSATVVDTGPAVTEWKTDDQVVMIALQTHHDNNDPFCRMGLPQLSSRRRVQGLHLDGGMAEFVSVQEEFLLPIPDGLDLKLAALTEPLSVAEHCIENRTSIGPDDKVIISGPGIIGLLCAISAKSRGAKVIISGTKQDDDTRLSAARAIGFETLVVGPDNPPLHEQITTYFPDGADALVEASGSVHALSDSWQSVRPNGIVTAVALYSRTIEFDLTQFLRKQIDLRTSYASSKNDYLRAFKLLQNGTVDSSLLTQSYSLSDAQKGFIDSEKLAVTKVILDCT